MFANAFAFRPYCKEILFFIILLNLNEFEIFVLLLCACIALLYLNGIQCSFCFKKVKFLQKLKPVGELQLV